MSDTQMQAGMQWVEARLKGLGEDEGSAVSPLGWDADILDLRTNRHNLVVLLNGQRQVMTFDDADLEDVPADPRLQIEVEGDLLALLGGRPTRGSLLD